jgi:hypothetical protein
MYRVLVDDSRLKTWIKLNVLRRILNVNNEGIVDPYFLFYYHTSKDIQTTAWLYRKTERVISSEAWLYQHRGKLDKGHL